MIGLDIRAHFFDAFLLVRGKPEGEALYKFSPQGLRIALFAADSRFALKGPAGNLHLHKKKLAESKGAAARGGFIKGRRRVHSLEGRGKRQEAFGFTDGRGNFIFQVASLLAGCADYFSQALLRKTARKGVERKDSGKKFRLRSRRLHLELCALKFAKGGCQRSRDIKAQARRVFARVMAGSPFIPAEKGKLRLAAFVPQNEFERFFAADIKKIVAVDKGCCIESAAILRRRGKRNAAGSVLVIARQVGKKAADCVYAHPAQIFFSLGADAFYAADGRTKIAEVHG
jgi:hypothetical protein